MTKRMLAYDPSHTISYGYWTCPTCKTSFYGGGETMHMKDCTNREQGYNACVYSFGPKEVEKVKEYAKRYGDDSDPPFSEFTMADLKKQFPHLVT